MNIIRQLKAQHDIGNAVKEALDSLPTAVGYFTPDGSVKLCNTAMYEIYRKIAQNDLQSYSELAEALKDCDRHTGIIRDGNVFLFPDGHARQYSARAVTTEDGRHYTEVLFSDVTDLYEKRRELEHQSQELKKMYTELRSLSGQLLEVTREQEILNMKARLHDQMNVGITAIRQILRQNTTSGENAAAVARFRRAIRVLQEENGNPQDDLSEFIRDAKVAGVEVLIRGTLPEEAEPLRLLIAVMREACVNAARHADASVLTVTAEQTEHASVLRITNDGRPPEAEVVPRGGLADLGKRIEKAGGTMEIRSLPEFILNVTLPTIETKSREEPSQ